MIETLAHRDMGSRLVSFLLILCRDFGVPNADGITIDLSFLIRRLRKRSAPRHRAVIRTREKMISIHKKDYGPQPGSFEPAIHLGKQEEDSKPGA